MANTKHIRNARQGGDVRAEIEEGLDEAVDPGAEPVELCSDCLAPQVECTCYHDMVDSWDSESLDDERHMFAADDDYYDPDYYDPFDRCW